MPAEIENELNRTGTCTVTAARAVQHPKNGDGLPSTETKTSPRDGDAALSVDRRRAPQALSMLHIGRGLCFLLFSCLLLFFLSARVFSLYVQNNVIQSLP